MERLKEAEVDPWRDTKLHGWLVELEVFHLDRERTGGINREQKARKREGSKLYSIALRERKKR